MKTRFWILIMLVLVGNRLSAQKSFSFMDCVTTSISGGYNFGPLVTGEPSTVQVHNIYKGDVAESTLRTRNYLNYSFESTYYIKAYRNFRIGLGFEYTTQRAYVEYISMPHGFGVQYPVIFAKYDRKFHLLGPSISVAFVIPKSKLRINYSFSNLFVKDRVLIDNSQRGEELYTFDNTHSDYYRYVIDDIDTDFGRGDIPVSLYEHGLDVSYRVASRFYLMLKFRKIPEYLSFYAEHRRQDKVNGVEEEEYIVEKLYVTNPRYQMGIGLSYHFFEKNNKQ